MTLREYIASHMETPFAWGEHDCLTFANGAAKVIRGRGFCNDWLGDYDTAMGARARYLSLMQIEGKGSIIDGLDERMERVDTLHPRDGLICARAEKGPLGFSFGVVCDGLEWYLSEADGLVGAGPDASALYWRLR